MPKVYASPAQRARRCREDSKRKFVQTYSDSVARSVDSKRFGATAAQLPYAFVWRRPQMRVPDKQSLGESANLGTFGRVHENDAVAALARFAPLPSNAVAKTFGFKKCKKARGHHGRWLDVNAGCGIVHWGPSFRHGADLERGFA